jgi:hypothetical protein
MLVYGVLAWLVGTSVLLDAVPMYRVLPEVDTIPDCGVKPELDAIPV